MRVAVAGAGIAGLTAALALADAGIDADLFDAAETLSEAGAGVQLSPNATRVLRALRLLEPVEASAVRPAAVHIRRGWDGAVLAALPLGQAAERRYGAPFLVAHRADLQAILLDAARAHPRITLTTGARLDTVEVAGDRVAIGLSGAAATPCRRTVDGLIGADGLRSQVRRSLPGAAGDPVIFSGRMAWRSLLPAREAPAFAREEVSHLWLGRDAHLVHYPVRGGTLVNVVAIVEDSWHGEAGESWLAPGDRDRLLHAFGGWSREARLLLDAAPDWRVWPLFERKILPRWSDGPLTLAGDAAHPMLPFLAQGAAQAIEDGGAIGRAAAGAADFATAAASYERVRKARAERVQRESRRQGTIYHLGPPASLARDAAFRWLGAERMIARYDWLYGS